MSLELEFAEDMEERLSALPEPDLDDADNPEWTSEDFARAERVNLSMPELYAKLTEATATRPVTLDVDAQVFDFFQSQGPDWRTRMSEALMAVAAKGVKRSA